MTIERKRCIDCNKNKRLTEYSPKGNGKLMAVCKWCRILRYRARVNADPYKAKVKSRLKRQKNPITVGRFKQRAKRLGIPFDLTDKQLKQLLESTIVCPVFGIPLAVSTTGRKQFNSPSIDRVKPELGYVYSNLVVISSRANTLKSNASSKELRQIADWMDALDQVDAEVRRDFDLLQEAADD